MTLKNSHGYYLVFVVLLVTQDWARADVLANSGYPMSGANPLRNNRVNKKILCPEVAPGRTQVWNIDSQVKLPDNIYDGSNIQLTQDEEGWIHFFYYTGPNTNLTFIKINPTTGAYDPALIYSSTLINTAAPTHTKDNRMYATDGSKTLVLNTKTMQAIAVLDHEVPTYAYSYAPLGNDFMVRSDNPAPIGPVVYYLNTTSLQFDDTQPFSPQFTYGRDIMVYKNASGIEIPIVATAKDGGAAAIVVSPNYLIVNPDYPFSWVDAYVESDQVILQYRTNHYPLVVWFFDANNGALLQNISVDNWEGESVSLYGAQVYGSRTLASVLFADYSVWLVEVLSGKTLLKDFTFYYNQFSNPSNSAWLEGESVTGGVSTWRIVSFDWDTLMMNAVGGYPNDYDIGYMYPSIVVDDACTLYSFYDDFTRHELNVFKPLPISNVMPILECINNNGIAYFSYRNMENKYIVIPYASDRNNLSPMNIAPAQDFRPNQRGKHYPLSSPVQLDNSTTSFTWLLEDYTLSFTTSKRHLCPTSAGVIITFNSTTTSMPNGFPEWIRLAFANVTQISPSRVNVTSSRVINATLRRAVQTDLEIELLVGPDPNGQEKTPEEAIQSFVNQGIDALNQLLSSSDYSSVGVSVKDVDGTPLDTELTGVLPPQTQPPTNGPSDNTPINAPINTPKGSVSSSEVLSPLNAMVVSFFVNFVLLFLN